VDRTGVEWIGQDGFMERIGEERTGGERTGRVRGWDRKGTERTGLEGFKEWKGSDRTGGDWIGEKQGAGGIKPAASTNYYEFVESRCTNFIEFME